MQRHIRVILKMVGSRLGRVLEENMRTIDWFSRLYLRVYYVFILSVTFIFKERNIEQRLNIECGQKIVYRVPPRTAKFSGKNVYYSLLCSCNAMTAFFKDALNILPVNYTK